MTSHFSLWTEKRFQGQLITSWIKPKLGPLLVFYLPCFLCCFSPKGRGVVPFLVVLCFLSEQEENPLPYPSGQSRSPLL